MPILTSTYVTPEPLPVIVPSRATEHFEVSLLVNTGWIFPMPPILILVVFPLARTPMIEPNFGVTT